MANRRLKVGIVGLRTDSWAANAHIPALRALHQDFELIGVANTNLASAQAAASHFAIPQAFHNAQALAASSDIDIVVVTVKAPHHYEVVKAAIESGKHVYCEWPFGNGLAQAEELTNLARTRGIVGVVGLQARFAPQIRYLKQLLSGGFVGEVLSTTVVGSGLAWGPQIDQANAYLLDRANGATMLTIPVCHALSAIHDVLGKLTVRSAMLVNRRTAALVVETGEMRPMTAHDQVLIEGVLQSGAPIAVHYRGGMPRGTGFLWEINGTEGDLQVTASVGHPQMVPLVLKGARGGDPDLRSMDVPAAHRSALPQNAPACGVAYAYANMAADLRGNTLTAPRFADGLDLHRMIATIEAAADRGV